MEERIKTNLSFEGMSETHLKILGQHAHEVVFEPGEYLFKEGDPSNTFYLVEKGAISLEAHDRGADGTAFIQALGPGDLLGWSWMFPPFAWHLQARAVTDVTAIALSGAHLLVVAEENHDFGYELMKQIAHLLINRFDRTRKELLRREAETVIMA